MLKSIAIVQARTGSSRLPAKVLLPVGGVPLVVLAARRAANTGRDVLVATSNEPSDDVLAELICKSGISCFRGSLVNTLQRLVDALDGYDNQTTVFRLTADNVLPDGSLLDEMEEEFIRLGLKYLCCNGERSGLPYGMSAELTRAQYLREAAAITNNDYDQEHVTPYIRRTYGEHYFERYKHLNMGHYRCTVDCLDDYFAINQVFSGIQAPEKVSAFDLIDRLPSATYQPHQSKALKKLVLGTAQLGFAYGIANAKGKPTQAVAENLIKTVIANGAVFVDTASAYGDSEEVIGHALKSGWEGRVQVITKLSPLIDCLADVTTTTVNALVDASIYQSCAALRTQQLDVLMLHRASHLSDWSGAVWARMLEHKARGIVKALGVSVQSPEELQNALAARDVEFIQMPFNLLDWRWDTLIAQIREVKQQRTLVIHVRSALLQGLLPSNSDEHWLRANVVNPQSVMKWLESQSREANCATVAEFCLSYVKSMDWVDGVVVGMENGEQLAENIRIFTGTDLTPEQIQSSLANRPYLEVTSLNPACWSK